MDQLCSIRIREYLTLKRNELSSMERHGGGVHVCDEVQEANLKRLHTVWFQPHEVLEKGKLRGCQELGEKRRGE